MSNLYKVIADDVNGSIIWVRANSIKDVSEAYKGVAIDSIAMVRNPAGVVVDDDLTVKDRDPPVTSAWAKS